MGARWVPRLVWDRSPIQDLPMSKTDRAEKAIVAAKEAREQKRELEKANGKLKSLARKGEEIATKVSEKYEKVALKVAERDSVERTLLVSVISNVSAGAATVGANALLTWVASKWPWLAARLDYAKGVPHLILGFGGASLEIATRGKGLVSLEREILYRTAETFGVIGAVRVGEALMNRSRAEKARYQQALAQQAQAQAQAQAPR